MASEDPKYTHERIGCCKWESSDYSDNHPSGDFHSQNVLRNCSNLYDQSNSPESGNVYSPHVLKSFSAPSDEASDDSKTYGYCFLKGAY